MIHFRLAKCTSLVQFVLRACGANRLAAASAEAGVVATDNMAADVEAEEEQAAEAELAASPAVPAARGTVPAATRAPAGRTGHSARNGSTIGGSSDA